MKKKTVFIELTPSEGYWLTQAIVEKEEDRVFSESVYCPQSQEDNWTEWTTEQKDEWEKERPIEMLDGSPGSLGTEGNEMEAHD